MTIWLLEDELFEDTLLDARRLERTEDVVVTPTDTCDDAVDVALNFAVDDAFDE